MEFLIKSTVQIDAPTSEQLRAIKGRIRNLLLDFGHDINVVVDFAPTEVWPGSAVKGEI